MSQSLSPWQNATVGVAAGTIEITILQPMLFMKNASQQKLKFTLNPRVLYRGLLASITNMSVLTGIQFPLTGLAKGLITGGESRPLASWEEIAAGFVGGAVSGLACCPMELVMIQQQRFGKSILATPAELVHKFGASVMTRGLLTSMGREGMFTAGYMGIGPSIAKYMREDHGLGEWAAKSCGSVGSGVIAATLSHPMDTIKTCMQGDVERGTYTTLSGTARTLLAAGGLPRFFSGWGWRTSRMICAMFIMSECKAQLSPLMFPECFTDGE